MKREWKEISDFCHDNGFSLLVSDNIRIDREFQENLWRIISFIGDAKFVVEKNDQTISIHQLPTYTRQILTLIISNTIYRHRAFFNTFTQPSKKTKIKIITFLVLPTQFIDIIGYSPTALVNWYRLIQIHPKNFVPMQLTSSFSRPPRLLFSPKKK